MTEVLFEVGYRHIVAAGAWDHQLFLAALALAYSPAEWRRWLLLATAFAVAHTLATGVLVAGYVPADMAWVEPAIFGSILATAAVEAGFLLADPYALRTAAPKLATSLLLAGGFGFVHGLGLGGAARLVLPPDLPPGEFLGGLLAFAAGVEVGQLGILAACWLVGFLAFELLQWYPVRLRVACLGAVGAVAIACYTGAL